VTILSQPLVNIDLDVGIYERTSYTDLVCNAGDPLSTPFCGHTVCVAVTIVVLEQ
jgi:hypothetical protein